MALWAMEKRLLLVEAERAGSLPFTRTSADIDVIEEKVPA
jgi:hypothetical protein